LAIVLIKKEEILDEKIFYLKIANSARFAQKKTPAQTMS
jgi:hypothetical protein